MLWEEKLLLQRDLRFVEEVAWDQGGWAGLGRAEREERLFRKRKFRLWQRHRHSELRGHSSLPILGSIWRSHPEASGREKILTRIANKRGSDMLWE